GRILAGGGGADVNGRGRTGFFLPGAGMFLEGAEAVGGVIESGEVGGGRGGDYAENGAGAFDEGDVDGEFAVALQEFLCAIEGVDEPEAWPGAALLEGNLGGLLRENGPAGGDAGEAFDDDA